MSLSPMTPDERVGALRLFGYSPREAEFLCLAALHGGYFLRRQYGAFLGRESGGSVAALIERATVSNHIKTAVFEHNTHLYHLATRPFYAAIGQPDNRNRRERQPFTIKNKLMALDFVLAHRDMRFLATEEEKVSHFAGALAVPPDRLPAKRYAPKSAGPIAIRYFVDKFPIFLTPQADGATFCFVDEGLTTASKFETHLNEYRSLLSAIPAFQVIYVAAHAAPFRRATRAFDRFVAELDGPGHGRDMDPHAARLLEYFSLRRRYESNALGELDRDRLIRLRALRYEFPGDSHESLYEHWKAEGDPPVLAAFCPGQPRVGRSAASFGTHLLEHNYDLFGTLTAF